MSLTAKVTDFADYLFTTLNSNKEELGVVDVFYGDQDRIPRTPTICVEPDEVNRVLNGVPRRVSVNLRAFLICYHSEVRSPQSNRRDADLLAEAVEETLHQDATLGGLVIHSFATSVQSGYATKNNAVFRASRITFEGTSQQVLGH